MNKPKFRGEGFCPCHRIGGTDESVYGPGKFWDITWLYKGQNYHGTFPGETANEAELTMKRLYGDDTVVLNTTRFK